MWTNPECEKQFETDMNTMQAIQAAVAKERGDRYSASKLQGESLLKARENWARTKVLSGQAKADAEFMARTEIALRTKILEAGILSADYLRVNWTKEIKATNAEITAYLSAHPEYDVKAKRAKAEMILRRAQTGEDFNRLAKEFSEDRSTKEKGGLHENIGKNTLWAEVERAALGLEKNQIAPRLVETETGWHIVKLENKQLDQNGETVNYSVRHILLQKNFEEPGSNNPDVPAPFLKAEEIAKSEVEKEKRVAFVERIAQINEISLPEDFTIESPAQSAPGNNGK
ncbi:MAG: peptidylprolyl isomerase [Pyrinomonadaceae bacterium]|nr:peptidylprolyl isomerase [Pyrinomonadaceae bacterium]